MQFWRQCNCVWQKLLAAISAADNNAIFGNKEKLPKIILLSLANKKPLRITLLSAIATKIGLIFGELFLMDKCHQK
jgi:hypothetical protein